MFKQLCYIVKNDQGYYIAYNDDCVFEDSSLAKRFHTIKDAEEATKGLTNFSILEVEFGFRVIRTIKI